MRWRTDMAISDRVSHPICAFDMTIVVGAEVNSDTGEEAVSLLSRRGRLGDEAGVRLEVG
jgi:hypothetical protein